MKVAIKLQDPSKLPVTVTLLSTIEELRLLRETLDYSKWPANELYNALGAALRDAEKTFYGESTK